VSEPITVAAFTKISEAEEAVGKLINGGVPEALVHGSVLCQ
jgi:hypothetical protein